MGPRLSLIRVTLAWHYTCWLAGRPCPGWVDMPVALWGGTGYHVQAGSREYYMQGRALARRHQTLLAIRRLTRSLAGTTQQAQQTLIRFGVSAQQAVEALRRFGEAYQRLER